MPRRAAEVLRYKHFCKLHTVHEFMNNTTGSRRTLLCSTGFGAFFAICKWRRIPSEFIRWVSDNFDSQHCHIRLSKFQVLPIQSEDIQRVYDLPNKGENVNPAKCKREVVKKLRKEFRWELEVKDVFQCKAKDLEQVILSCKSDRIWCKAVILYLLSCFLCPDKNETVSLRYAFILEDLTNVSKYNWCKYILNHLRAGTKGRVYPQSDMHFFMIHYIERMGRDCRYSLGTTLPTLQGWDTIRVLQQLDAIYKNSGFGGGITDGYSINPKIVFESPMSLVPMEADQCPLEKVPIYLEFCKYQVDSFKACIKKLVKRNKSDDEDDDIEMNYVEHQMHDEGLDEGEEKEAEEEMISDEETKEDEVTRKQLKRSERDESEKKTESDEEEEEKEENVGYDHDVFVNEQQVGRSEKDKDAEKVVFERSVSVEKEKNYMEHQTHDEGLEEGEKEEVEEEMISDEETEKHEVARKQLKRSERDESEEETERDEEEEEKEQEEKEENVGYDHDVFVNKQQVGMSEKEKNAEEEKEQKEKEENVGYDHDVVVNEQQVARSEKDKDAKKVVFERSVPVVQYVYRRRKFLVKKQKTLDSNLPNLNFNKEDDVSLEKETNIPHASPTVDINTKAVREDALVTTIDAMVLDIAASVIKEHTSPQLQCVMHVDKGTNIEQSSPRFDLLTPTPPDDRGKLCVMHVDKGTNIEQSSHRFDLVTPTSTPTAITNVEEVTQYVESRRKKKRLVRPSKFLKSPYDLHVAKAKASEKEKNLVSYVWSENQLSVKPMYKSNMDDVFSLSRLGLWTLQEDQCVSNLVLDTYAFLLNLAEKEKGAMRRLVLTASSTYVIVAHVSFGSKDDVRDDLQAAADFLDKLKSFKCFLPYRDFDITSLEYILIPCLHREHYVTYVLNLKNRSFDYLSTLVGFQRPMSTYEQIGTMLMREACCYVSQRFESMQMECPYKWEQFKWVDVKVPLQPDSKSCGVLTMTFLEHLKGDPNKIERFHNWNRLSKANKLSVINQIRIDLCSFLITHKTNSLKESIQAEADQFCTELKAKLEHERGVEK